MNQFTPPSFFQAFLTHPWLTGAIIPSSRGLAAAMAEAAPLAAARVVVELGAGTGAITGELLRRMDRAARLICFETNPAFADWLGREFRDPRLLVVSESAARLREVLDRLGLPLADCVFSGLPFQALPLAETEAILAAARRSMGPRSHFVAFQYTKLQEPALRRAFGAVRQTGRVWRNLPPARIYHCQIGLAPLERSAG